MRQKEGLPLFRTPIPSFCLRQPSGEMVRGLTQTRLSLCGKGDLGQHPTGASRLISGGRRFPAGPNLPYGPSMRRFQTTAGALALIGFLLAPPQARALPDPTKPGRFAVGVTSLRFTTTSVATGATRILDTRVWYPAVPGTGTTTTLGARDARVQRGRHPLVIFSHGSCGLPEQSVFLTTALASWGFVVAAPPHPGNEIFDGFPACFTASFDSLRERPHDVSVVIDGMLATAKDRGSMFARHIAPRRIGMSGHSLGGITTLLVAEQDPRVRAALALAPAVVRFVAPQEPVRIPFMVQAAEMDSLAPLPDSQAAYNLAGPPRFLLEILNTGHFAWADVCAGSLFGVHDCDPPTLSQDDAHALVLRYAVPFLSRYLAGHRRFGRLLSTESVPAGALLTADVKR